ncbi:MAG: helix-turn-helix transcriptional regulator [Opitutales bacterium]|nr:helix-turn-helix transcriptional regulator [Opitutales bacterium]
MPCANASFNLINLRLSEISVARSRGIEVPVEEDTPLLQNLGEHRMIMRILCDNAPGVMEFGDFYTRREYHRTRLYNEYYRRSDTQQQLCFQVARSESDCAVMAINHVSGSRFATADRVLAALLGEHMRAAFRSARKIALWRAIAERLEKTPYATGVAPVVLDRGMRPLNLSNDAAALLRAYFPRTGQWSYGLPNVIGEWMKQQPSPPPDGPPLVRRSLRVEGANGTLEAELRPGSDTLLPLLLLSETPSPAASEVRTVECFRRRGLSTREGQVLHWIAEGKTNPEIAELLGISPRTVHKHCEHIYSKLGVENRQTALLMAQSLLQEGKSVSCRGTVGLT